MKIEKAAISPLEIGSRYFELTESILRAMIDSTLAENFPAVFALNRPLFHASYKAMWISLVENPSDMPDDLLKLGADIDAVIEEKFRSWNAPFVTGGSVARYAGLLTSPVHKQLSDEGKMKPTTVVERLHNDVHGGLPSLEYYERLVKHGQLRHSAKELCVIGHSPLYLNLRFALSKRFPSGPVTPDKLLFEPFTMQMLAIYNMPD